jgi:hypothetical protein
MKVRDICWANWFEKGIKKIGSSTQLLEEFLSLSPRCARDSSISLIGAEKSKDNDPDEEKLDCLLISGVSEFGVCAEK